MGFLKGLAASLAGFILFWALLLLGSVISLQATVLNPAYLNNQVAKMDVAGLLQDTVGKQIKQQIPPVLQDKAPLVDELCEDVEPWAKEQLTILVTGALDYFTGRTDTLSITVDMRPLKSIAATKLPQLGLPFEDSYVIDASMIPPPLDMALPFIRWVGSNMQLLFWGLIGLAVLMVACTVLLYRTAKGVARTLGSTFFIIGLVEFIIPMVLALWVLPMLLPDITAVMGKSVGGLLTQTMVDTAAPLKTFGIGFAAAGAALYIFSIFYKRGAAD